MANEQTKGFDWRALSKFAPLLMGIFNPTMGAAAQNTMTQIDQQKKDDAYREWQKALAEKEFQAQQEQFNAMYPQVDMNQFSDQPSTSTGYSAPGTNPSGNYSFYNTMFGGQKPDPFALDRGGNNNSVSGTPAAPVQTNQSFSDSMGFQPAPVKPNMVRVSREQLLQMMQQKQRTTEKKALFGKMLNSMPAGANPSLKELLSDAASHPDMYDENTVMQAYYNALNPQEQVQPFAYDLSPYQGKFSKNNRSASYLFNTPFKSPDELNKAFQNAVDEEKSLRDYYLDKQRLDQSNQPDKPTQNELSLQHYNQLAAMSSRYKHVKDYIADLQRYRAEIVQHIGLAKYNQLLKETENLDPGQLGSNFQTGKGSPLAYYINKAKSQNLW